jgi:peptide chain release factor 1
MPSKLPLQLIIDKYNNINEQLLTTQETDQLIKLGKELKRLQPQYDLASKIDSFYRQINDNTELLKNEKDNELVEMLNLETQEAKDKIITLEEKLLSYMTPVDPRDDNDIFLEIRAGAGGDESSLFVGELLRAYSIMAQKLGFNFKIIDFHQGTVGGYKEVIIEIRGDSVYSWFKYEGGVHRVQRVPATEKQGRVHTSTISIAIMPLIEESGDFQLDLKDVEIIASTSQGAGGQSVNTTYSAIQVLHKPTGIRAQCQDERNQQQNRIKALQILTSRVFDFYEQERLAKEYAERKMQVGTADRSEKIRTYNYPQDRISDHRYNHNWTQIPNIMNGDIVNVIEDIKKMAAQANLENLQNQL